MTVSSKLYRNRISKRSLPSCEVCPKTIIYSPFRIAPNAPGVAPAWAGGKVLAWDRAAVRAAWDVVRVGCVALAQDVAPVEVVASGAARQTNYADKAAPVQGVALVDGAVSVLQLARDADGEAAKVKSHLVTFWLSTLRRGGQDARPAVGMYTS